MRVSRFRNPAASWDGAGRSITSRDMFVCYLNLPTRTLCVCTIFKTYKVFHLHSLLHNFISKAGIFFFLSFIVLILYCNITNALKPGRRKQQIHFMNESSICPRKGQLSSCSTQHGLLWRKPGT